MAANFVAAFINLCHTFDDINDQDKPCDDKRMVKDFLAFQGEMLLNPWVRERYLLLWPLIVTALNAWLDSNDWAVGSDRQKRQDSDVIKGWYHEPVWFCAFLCGGWEHYRHVTSTMRDYQHETHYELLQKEAT